VVPVELHRIQLETAKFVVLSYSKNAKRELNKKLSFDEPFVTVVLETNGALNDHTTVALVCSVKLQAML